MIFCSSFLGEATSGTTTFLTDEEAVAFALKRFVLKIDSKDIGLLQNIKPSLKRFREPRKISRGATEFYVCWYCLDRTLRNFKSDFLD